MRINQISGIGNSCIQANESKWAEAVIVDQIEVPDEAIARSVEGLIRRGPKAVANIALNTEDNGRNNIKYLPEAYQKLVLNHLEECARNRLYEVINRLNTGDPVLTAIASSAAGTLVAVDNVLRKRKAEGK